MMVLPDFHQITLLGFTALVLATAISDARHFRIPNLNCLLIAALYPASVLTSATPVDWVGALAIGGGVLAVGFLLYAGGKVGGGDAKLVATVALWAGPALFLEFLLITGIAGGVMAAVLWVRHRFSRAASPGLFFVAEVDPDFRKRPMPYAIAIATGALYVAFTLLGVG